MNRQLEAKARAVAGWKGYTTNLVGMIVFAAMAVSHYIGTEPVGA